MDRVEKIIWVMIAIITVVSIISSPKPLTIILNTLFITIIVTLRLVLNRVGERYEV